MSGKKRYTYSKLRAAFVRAVRSSKGKSVLQYLLFVCVAFVFWLVLSLDAEVQRDFDVPLSIEDVPDSVTIISDVPNKISAVVQAKGSQLLRYAWGAVPPLKFKFNDFANRDADVFGVSKSKLESRLRDYFGQSVELVSARPDSLWLVYTSAPGVRVPLKINAEITPDLQCIISGSIKAGVDSVTVYASGGVPRSLSEAETEWIVRTDLRDTCVYEVRIKSVPGVRFIPDKVNVTVPVEPLISKRRVVPVEVINLPEGIGLITFPSSVDVTYLVPMSAYNDDFPIKAYADYNSLDLGKSHVKLTPSLVPELYRNVTLHPDSVEYILEKLRTYRDVARH